VSSGGRWPDGVAAETMDETQSRTLGATPNQLSLLRQDRCRGGSAGEDEGEDERAAAGRLVRQAGRHV
jgi:hypothetical protein